MNYSRLYGRGEICNLGKMEKGIENERENEVVT